MIRLKKKTDTVKNADKHLLVPLIILLALIIIIGICIGTEDNTPVNTKSAANTSSLNTSSENTPKDTTDIDQNPEYELSSGWTITSYQDVNEKLYTGKKIEIFDAQNNSLGFYKTDFLEQIRIDGSGKGDRTKNSGQFLHYDYGLDDGKTHYLVDISQGAYNNELVSWAGDRPSIAVNPPLPYGAKIRFRDLGPEAVYNPGWVNELLKTRTFYADDRFYGYGEDEKKIDVYVGLQTSREAGGPESLLMHNVTIAVRLP
ncbi:MAG: hypothetical protein U9P44_01580 [archaeon]|nr:hypothetical protein [archaeon]